jgi:DNA-binding transcriptional ArsR family regulator
VVKTFEALADDTRTGIVAALADRPRTVSEIVDLFDVSQPAISQHLRVLRDAGLVSVQPAGRSRIYHLDPSPLAELDRWLDRYRKLWATRLDALESHMEANPE